LPGAETDIPFSPVHSARKLHRKSHNDQAQQSEHCEQGDASVISLLFNRFWDPVGVELEHDPLRGRIADGDVHECSFGGHFGLMSGFKYDQAASRG